MHCGGKYKLWSHYTSYCLIELVTKVGLTVVLFIYFIFKRKFSPEIFAAGCYCLTEVVTKAGLTVISSTTRPLEIKYICIKNNGVICTNKKKIKRIKTKCMPFIYAWLKTNQYL